MALTALENRLIYDSNFSDRIPVISWSEDELYYCIGDDKTAYLGYCFIGEPLPGTNESVRQKLGALLNLGFPEGTFVHAMLYGSPDLEQYLGNMMGLRVNAEEMMYKAVDGRREFIQRASKKAQSKVVKALVKNFVFEFDVKIPIKLTGGRLDPTPEDIKNVKESRVQVGQVLESIGFRCKPARPETFLRFMGSILNWGEDASWRVDRPLWDPNQEIRAQIKDRDVDVEVFKNYMRLGNKYVAAMSPRKLPSDHHLFVMDRLVGDQLTGRGMLGNFFLSLIVYYPPAAETKQSIEAKSAAMKYQAFGPMLKWFPEIGNRVKSFEILTEAMGKGEPPVMICPSVFLFEDTVDELKGAVSYTKTYYREWGWLVQEDQFIQLPMLLNHLPFGADLEGIKFLGRFGTVAARHAVEFMPCASDWKGTGTPVISLFSRNNQLMTLDFYNSNSNFNACVAAASGSGKSFFVNDIVVSYLSTGGRFWIIDVGRSYLNICNELGGQFLAFTEDADICLNPFTQVEDFEEDGEILKGALIAMAQENTELNDPQLAGLSQALRDVWNTKGKEACVDDVANWLLASPDERLNDVGRQLYPFTKDGPYGRFFYGEANVDFKNNFTVLELEELKGRPALQRVVLMMLIYKIQHAMYLGGTKQRKFLVIDEAWELLSHGSVAKFIEAGYRKFRKYAGSAMVITQSIEDLYQSDAGKAIAANSAFKLLLGQTPESVESMKRNQRLAIGEWGFEMLRQVHTVKREYSEVFVYYADGMGVGRLIVSPFSRLLYSTDPDDRNAIRAKTEQGMTVPEAIGEIVKERGMMA